MSDALVFEDVVVRYGRTPVLDAFSCAVGVGEVVGLVGPNGSGKTTAIRAALGLTDTAGGQIRVLGRRVDTLRRSEIARTIGYVPQRSRLEAAIRVRDVVTQGRYSHRSVAALDDDRKAVDEALAWTDLTHLASRSLPTLSGGERMRVIVARALATEAPILLMDEPTAALDVGHALQLLRLIRELADDGRAVVLVVHDLEQARRVCDRIVVIDGGSRIVEGAPEDVLFGDDVSRVFEARIIRGGGLGYEARGPS